MSLPRGRWVEAWRRGLARSGLAGSAVIAWRRLVSPCFFFSSRRRHTRFDCDWSSDVCSSDLWTPPGYVFQCPGGVQKIMAWILAGAPACGAVDGDPSPDPALVVCDLNQPVLDPPAPPADGVQLAGTTFTVDRPARSAKQVTTLPIGAASTCDNTLQQCFITGIDITASAGTEYVTVARA